VYTVRGLVELHEGKKLESSSGWEAFRRGPGNYEVLLSVFNHEPPAIQLTPVSRAQAAALTGSPEPPVIANAKDIVFEEGFATYFNVSVSREGRPIDRPVYFTATAVGAG
jgi:hypothetical protein